MREWFEDQLENFPNSDVYFEGLMKLGGPQKRGSKAWHRAYPPYWRVRDKQFASLESAQEYMKGLVQEYLSELPDYEPAWNCPKCGQIHYVFSPDNVRYNPARYFEPAYYTYYGLPGDRWRSPEADGYIEYNSYAPTNFNARAAAETLTRICSCGHAQDTKTKEQTDGKSIQ